MELSENGELFFSTERKDKILVVMIVFRLGRV